MSGAWTEVSTLGLGIFVFLIRKLRFQKGDMQSQNRDRVTIINTTTQKGKEWEHSPGTELTILKSNWGNMLEPPTLRKENIPIWVLILLSAGAHPNFLLFGLWIYPLEGSFSFLAFLGTLDMGTGWPTLFVNLVLPITSAFKLVNSFLCCLSDSTLPNATILDSLLTFFLFVSSLRAMVSLIHVIIINYFNIPMCHGLNHHFLSTFNISIIGASSYHLVCKTMLHICSFPFYWFYFFC